MLEVVKRDGIVSGFESGKIYDAVFAAAKSEGYSEYDCHNVAVEIQTKVSEKLNKKGGTLTVEDIQHSVEKQLMLSKWKDVCIAYIEFRSDRDNKREEKSKWVKLGLDILDGTDQESQRENSNVPRDSILTKLEIMKRQYNKNIANDFIIPKKFKIAHDSGDIHVHDMDAVVAKVHNCMLLDYPYMFKNGFQLGNKWIERPNTILTAMNVLVQMVQVQSNLQFGGLTLADVDIHMAPFVRGSYDKYIEDALEDFETDVVTDKIKKVAMKRTKREVYRAAKLLSYQLNTLQVRGESSPFVTITYGLSTEWEGRMIQQCILEERLDEFKKSGVQAFPKHQLQCVEGINLNNDDPNYDLFKLANKVSSISCYPDYIFPDNQRMHTGGSASYMGCRSLLSPWYDEEGNLTYLGRGNAGVTSVNLPRIAMEAEGDKELFFKILADRLDLTIDSLHWRYKRLISLKAKEVEFSYIGGAFGMEFEPEESIEKAFADGRGSISIGYIGLHEVTLAMLGEEPYTSRESLEFQKTVLSFINERIDKEKKETGLGFSLYSTPSESLTDRFCKLDQKKFGMVEGITDKGFYINSYHVNTETVLTPFEKMDIEAELQPLALGGHISYIEASSLTNNLEAFETFIKYAYEKGIMHFAINSPWDFCKTCHWTGELKVEEATGFDYTCPNCGEHDQDQINMTRRLCGYVAPINKRPPVEGRVKEIQSRTKHH